METIGNQMETPFKCDKCSKSYANRGGLWKHVQKCKALSADDIDKMKKDNEIELLKQQVQMLREQIEMLKLQNELLIKQISTPQITNIDMSNNKVENKQTFNLNFYLNETCKNAITMKQFIEKIPTPNFSEFEKFIV
jgi:hypothetical protein